MDRLNGLAADPTFCSSEFNGFHPSRIGPNVLKSTNDNLFPRLFHRFLLIAITKISQFK